ncbi:hypothetical protein HDU76_006820 [Blyttiomyces sp. JEL0837]|nr:hypothetical protein HDU76_006820 [Blyttiomyces sp. JEL0837]
MINNKPITINNVNIVTNFKSSILALLLFPCTELNNLTNLCIPTISAQNVDPTTVVSSSTNPGSSSTSSALVAAAILSEAISRIGGGGIRAENGISEFFKLMSFLVTLKRHLQTTPTADCGVFSKFSSRRFIAWLEEVDVTSSLHDVSKAYEYKGGGNVWEQEGFTDAKGDINTNGSDVADVCKVELEIQNVVAVSKGQPQNGNSQESDEEKKRRLVLEKERKMGRCGHGSFGLIEAVRGMNDVEEPFLCYRPMLKAWIQKWSPTQ